MIDLADAQSLAEAVKKYVTFNKPFEIIPVGSIRRGKAQMKDVDFLIVVSSSIDGVLSSMRMLPSGGKLKIISTYASGEKRRSCIIKMSGMMFNVDFFIATKAEKPFALYHHTGPASYNIRIRAYARNKGWKLNQYGLFNAAGEKILGRKPCKTEKDVADLLGVTYWEPHLRR